MIGGNSKNGRGNSDGLGGGGKGDSNVPMAIDVTREDEGNNYVAASITPNYNNNNNQSYQNQQQTTSATPTYSQYQQQTHFNQNNKINSRDPVRAHCDVCNTDVVTNVRLEAGTGMLASLGICCWFCPCLCLCLPLCVEELYDATHTCPRCNNVIGKKKVIHVAV